MTGDAVHFQMSWNRNMVPRFNWNKQKSLESIIRLRKLVRKHRAKIWITHDKGITEWVRKKPFYE